MPDCLSAYSSSLARYAGLTLTRIAPMRAVAYCVTTHSQRLGAQMPTRSPLAMPRAMSASASRVVRFHSSR